MLYPESKIVERTPAHIDALLDLLRRYWRAHPTRRFEQVVNDVLTDYHYTDDEQVAQNLRRRLGEPT